MLVLTRKKGERIRIGSTIEVAVLEVHRDKVKLGFSGPVDTRILRAELYQKMEVKSGKGAGGA